MTNSRALRMRAVVFRQMLGDLQPHGRLARALFAEHDRRGRIGRIAVDFVPGRMVHAGDAVFLEHRIGLRIFLGERIGGDAVMFEELLNLHAADDDARNRKRLAARSISVP